MTSSTQVQRQQPGRGPGGRGAGLSREQIVEKAVALMDAEGTRALTLRRLAKELGVEAPALYWHFADKGELCREVVRAVGEQLQVTSTTRGTPRRRLEHHFHAVRDHWRAHPGVLELSRQFPPSAAGEVARHGLRLVEELGIAPDDALEYYRSLSWTVTGFVILEQTLDESVHHRRIGPTRWELDLDDDAPPSAFDTDELFRTTLGLALDGLERRST
jgi:TetR/AcrR family transcriptional regulator, tetracycline repressor protein